MLNDNSRFTLPERPDSLADAPVAGWAAPVTIPTFETGVPEQLPAYLDMRVYQGSSGKVLPLPMIESIDRAAHPRAWQAVHLENEYVRLMVLPELGGRIHVAFDKVSGQDFFYRNNTIKPALVGLAGPWISGGVEFNWPQHHRPGTHLPTDWEIEHEDDGSVTVWCSDHDPFTRMKGMHGIRLRPGTALIEARVRLFNRTAVTQTFLWWTNIAVRVHDDYQSFFPTDVHMVADHAKRAVTAFPVADRPYYGVDYPARADRDSPHYVGPDANRLDWYRNIPVPTSYMCVGSADDFFGGYDHAAGLGFVLVADHRIAPGKKQWTWGNAQFGWAWDANLTERDGPYIELMAGAYTDNQPDFSYLTPGETKAFSQFWYPFHEIGPAHQATTEAAARLDVTVVDGTRTARIGVASPRPLEAVVVLHDDEGQVLWRKVADVRPGQPLQADVPITGEGPVELVVAEAETELLRCASESRTETTTLEPATELAPPEKIESADELYFAGMHLAQYRHATRSPQPYWEEILRRDPLDSRAHVALAGLRLRDGRLDEAERHLRAAIARETRRNPNPPTGEAHYLLGVTLDAAGRAAEAYDAYAKSMWNSAWRTPAHLALARLDARAGRWQAALQRARQALRTDTDQLQARAIAVVALRRLGHPDEATDLVAETTALDPLDAWIRDLRFGQVDTDALTLADVAAEYSSLGLLGDTLRVLDAASRAAELRPVPAAGNPLPLLHYRRAEVLAELHRDSDAAEARQLARKVDARTCFPRGASDARLLERTLARDDADARAHSLLGQWLYGEHRYDDAVAHLNRAAELDPTDIVALRGLALAAYNVSRDTHAAMGLYQRALSLAPDNGRLLYEADQLARRAGVDPAIRRERLEQHPAVTMSRDDLTIAYCELLVLTGHPAQAVESMASRRFSPWEGGEGEALRVWSAAQSAIAAEVLADGRPDMAVTALEAALSPPANLGEARHPLANDADLLLALGDALCAAGRESDARATWEQAALRVGDFAGMSGVPYSPMTYYSVLASKRLGNDERATFLTAALAAYVGEERAAVPAIDYFATSLPTMLTFRPDLRAVHAARVSLLEAQLAILEGRAEDARAIVGRLRQTDPCDLLVRAVSLDVLLGAAA
ncbi:DUF5107 domain-containing protein [Cellulomonas sp. WB94]|uniref:tetratricopeptide repeat protein n=1 Tax=Cellulomonas sp. WB94 TaxID=2173174 RepID=UPI000D57E1AC|nr:DUF5107 domain-containing protein [Cellulomonas sp. WB94]PVU83869.1 DUF5107 domain-containing protein [Cellulomonas sp. WB94]